MVCACTLATQRSTRWSPGAQPMIAPISPDRYSTRGRTPCSTSVSSAGVGSFISRLHELVDGVVARRQQPMDEDRDVTPQLFFRRLARARPSRAASLVPRMPSIADLHHLAIEAEFVPEMVVDRGDIGARRAANLADRHLLEAAIGKQTLSRFEQPGARFAVSRLTVTTTA